MDAEPYTFTQPVRFRLGGDWHELREHTWQQLYKELLRFMWHHDRERFERHILTMRGSKLPWFSQNLDDLNTHEVIYLDYCGFHAYAKLSAEQIARRCARIAEVMGFGGEFDVDTGSGHTGRTAGSIPGDGRRAIAPLVERPPLQQPRSPAPYASGLQELVAQLASTRQQLAALRADNQRLQIENEQLRVAQQESGPGGVALQHELETLKKDCKALREENRVLTRMVAKLAVEREKEQH